MVKEYEILNSLLSDIRAKYDSNELNELQEFLEFLLNVVRLARTDYHY